MIMLVWIGFLIWVFSILGMGKLAPWLNKEVFSRIWSEEDRPMVAREAIDRIKELCIDGNVPEETAILMAAKEHGLNERQLLNSFSADDAKDLIRILSGKKPNYLALMTKKVGNVSRQNMHRKYYDY